MIYLTKNGKYLYQQECNLSQESAMAIIRERTFDGRSIDQADDT